MLDTTGSPKENRGQKGRKNSASFKLLGLGLSRRGGGKTFSSFFKRRKNRLSLWHTVASLNQRKDLGEFLQESNFKKRSPANCVRGAELASACLPRTKTLGRVIYSTWKEKVEATNLKKSKRAPKMPAPGPLGQREIA